MKPIIIRTGVLLVVIIVFILVASPPTTGIYKKLQEAALQEAISNSRQIKLSLDAFEMDNNGAYPNTETAKFYETSGNSSNELFHQLFASSNLGGNGDNMERMFWIKGHPTWCHPTQPDGIIGTDNAFDPSQTLRPGDNAYAYVHGLTNKSPTDHPLLFPAPGSGPEGSQIWNGDWFLLTIDGAIIPVSASQTDGLTLKTGRDALSPAVSHWHGTPPDIRLPLPPVP